MGGAAPRGRPELTSDMTYAGGFSYWMALLREFLSAKGPGREEEEGQRRQASGLLL